MGIEPIFSPAGASYSTIRLSDSLGTFIPSTLRDKYTLEPKNIQVLDCNGNVTAGRFSVKRVSV